MPMYRIEKPATICFTVTADNEEAAVEAADKTLREVADSEYGINLPGLGETVGEQSARLYPDPEAIPEVVDEYE